jgi:hypothetical protein
MKNLFKVKNLTLMLSLFILLSSCNNDDETTAPVDNSITGLALKTQDLSILVEALQRAELTATLQARWDLHCFAPTYGFHCISSNKRRMQQ